MYPPFMYFKNVFDSISRESMWKAIRNEARLKEPRMFNC